MKKPVSTQCRQRNENEMGQKERGKLSYVLEKQKRSLHLDFLPEPEPRVHTKVL